MLSRIKEICFNIATLGTIGEWKTGGLVASLLAIPLLFILRAIRWVKPAFHVTAIILIVALIALCIHFALHYQTDKDPSILILDKPIGFMIVLFGIPFSLKLMLIGFLLFHALTFFMPTLTQKLWDLNFDNLPDILGIFANDLVSGFIVNIFLHMILWIAQ